MKVLIDSIIYSLKKTGGVRRYFDGLLKYLPKIDKNIEIELVTNANFFKLLKCKGDIFHSTYYTRHPDKKIAQVVTVYDMIAEIFPHYSPGIKQNLFKWKKRKIVEAADAVICISKNTKKDLLKYYKVDEDKVSIIYPGVDEKLKKISSKKAKNNFLTKFKIKKPFLLYVGTRGRYKNFLKLAKAYSLWKRKADFNIICVGGPKFHKFREIDYFKKLNLKNNIFYFKNISDKDLILFYNTAHALVCPSFYEGFGFPVLEAMSSGCLVLASKMPTFTEVGKDFLLYFDPKSLKSIVKALNASLNKKNLNNLIKKGLQRAKYFSWPKTAEQTLKVYKQILK